MNSTGFSAYLLTGLLFVGSAVAAEFPANAGPQDPGATVPVSPYRSVFPRPESGQAKNGTSQDTPGANWIKANETVGQFTRGHVDILRAESAPTNPPLSVPGRERP